MDFNPVCGMLVVVALLGMFAWYGLKDRSENRYRKESDRNRPGPDISQKGEYLPGDTIETYVAGVTFENRQEIIKNIELFTWLSVGREEDNQFDSNAIAIYSKEGAKVGYINKDLAEKIAKVFDQYTLPNGFGNPRASVIEKTNPGTDRQGLKIKFRLPDKDSINRDVEIDLYTSYIPW